MTFEIQHYWWMAFPIFGMVFSIFHMVHQNRLDIEKLKIQKLMAEKNLSANPSSLDPR